MKKNITLLSIACALSVSVFAGNPESEAFLETNSNTKEINAFSLEDEDASTNSGLKHVIKLNINQLALKNIALQYELIFHKNFSGAVGLNFLIPQKVPGFKDPIDETETETENSGSVRTITTTNIFQEPAKLKGFAITPELRYYPGGKSGSGFYIAPYFRYASYNASTTGTLSASAEEFDSSTGNTSIVKVNSDNEIKFKYSGFTGGLMIGRQWLIGEHFSIDWWIIGGGYGKGKFKGDLGYTMTATPSDASSDEDIAKARKELDEQLTTIIEDAAESIPYGDIRVTSTSNADGVVAEVTGLPMLSIRGFGLNLGFYF